MTRYEEIMTMNPKDRMLEYNISPEFLEGIESQEQLAQKLIQNRLGWRDGCEVDFNMAFAYAVQSSNYERWLSETVMPRCPKCFRRVKIANAKFCHYCGANMESED